MTTLAIDARYNIFRAVNNPQFRTLYIRRRSQLLREKSRTEKIDLSINKNYNQIRSILLSQKYGIPPISDQCSVRSNLSHSRNTLESLDTSGRQRNRPEPPLHDAIQRLQLSEASIMPTLHAGASRAMAGRRSITENYSFSGVHHIFDQHKHSVTAVRFANDDKSRLACSSLDMTISICQMIPPPATVVCLLQGHTAGINDFAWSLSNDSILSCSNDGTSRLWQVSSGECIRVIPNPNQTQVTTCLFQPINNNLFAIGDNKNLLSIMNLSTGKVVKGGSCSLSGAVLSLAFDVSGRILWTGDSSGTLCSFIFDLMSGKLTKAKRLSIAVGHPITSISYQAWISREARDPSLLINSGNNTLSLFRVVGEDGEAKLRRRFTIRQRDAHIRSTFCPLISFRPGACVVSGSEDMTVLFFDVSRDQRACINSLQGHSAPVLSVAFSHDESLLASSDANGVVIIWKKDQKKT